MIAISFNQIVYFNHKTLLLFILSRKMPPEETEIGGTGGIFS